VFFARNLKQSLKSIYDRETAAYAHSFDPVLLRIIPDRRWLSGRKIVLSKASRGVPNATEEIR
jgi:hypothetical protein